VKVRLATWRLRAHARARSRASLAPRSLSLPPCQLLWMCLLVQAALAVSALQQAMRLLLPRLVEIAIG